jgi:cytochrome oxidase Cu insertion factor (SCO1/SenC/PrrC family)
VRRYSVAKSAVVLALFLVFAAVALRFTVSPPSAVFGVVIGRHVSTDALTSDSGKIVHLNDTPRGALIVLGYTRCTDTCPITVANVVAAARGIPRALRPSLFFLTVDPTYDTPPVLHRYLATWGNELVGLTGDGKSLRRVSASLGAGADFRPSADHDTRLFLLDHTGALVRDIPPDVAADDLRHLLASIRVTGAATWERSGKAHGRGTIPAKR